jgi:HK97 family phage major capsid protein
MKRILDLNSDISAKEVRMAAIFADCEKEKRSRTADEVTEWSKLKGEVEALKNEVRDLEAQEKINAANAKPVTFEKEGGEGKEKREMNKKVSVRKILSSVSSRKALDGAEREAVEEAQREMRAAGVEYSDAMVQVPAWVLADQRAMSTTAANGGHNIQTDIASIIDVLLPYMVLGNLPIQRFSGLTGNLKFPTASTARSAGWNTEIGSATEKDPQFSSATLSPKRLAAFITTSNQLLGQSSNSIEQYLRSYLIGAQAIEFEKACLLGGGSNEPSGIGSAVTANVFAGGAATNGTNANGAAPVWADIVNLVKVASMANAQGQAYVWSPKVTGKLQVTGRQSGGVEGNFILPSAQGQVNGYNFYATNNSSDTLTKGASASICSQMIFGDFTKFAVGSWGGVEIGVNPYSKMLTAQTDMVLNSYVDCAVLNTSAFAVIKDALAA